MMEALESQFTKILKRDGSVASFDLDRIIDAIFKAAQAVGGQDRNLSVQLAHQVIDRLQTITKGKRTPSVEEVQDTVEKTLIEAGHAKTAKAFILYRQKRKEVREIRSSFLAIEKTVDQYLQGQETLKLTTHISFPGLQKYAAENILSNYALNKLYPPQISEAHRDGIIYIHDLGSPIAGSSVVLNRGKNPTLLEDTLSYLKKIELLSQEWASRVILEDFEGTLKLWKGCYQFLRFDDRSASFFLFIQKPEILKTLLAEPQKDFNLPGLIIKGSLLVRHPITVPLILSNIGQTQIDSPTLLGILPVKQVSNLPKTCLGAVSLNLKRAAQESTSKKDFFINLEKYLQTAKQALLIKKKIFEQNLNAGIFPETQSELGQPIEGFLCVVPVGLFQAALDLTPDNSIQSKMKLALEIFHILLERLQSFQEELSHPFAIDFISRCLSPFYEKETEEIHEALLDFKELFPFATLLGKSSQIIQKLSSHKLDCLAWVWPKLS
jgi:anaerobic ribonucleoside-triphosphate reductase